MMQVMKEQNTYLAQFDRLEKDLGRIGGPALQRVRKAARAHFEELGFPTLRSEDWKFTNVSSLARKPFVAAQGLTQHGLTVKRVQRAAFGFEEGCRLVFVNGHYAPDLSRLDALPAGVILCHLVAALDTHSQLIEPYLARYASCADNAFTALNTTFLRDGAFLFIPRNQILEEPIHLVYVSTAPGEATMSHPRNLIVVGENSQLSLVESFVGLQDDVYFTNAVTEVVAGAHSVVDHYKLQQESEEAYHIATLQVHQDRNSNFASHYIGLGGALVRHEVRTKLDAEGCECTLNGLYVAGGKQHMDNHTVIDHARPHCASHELYKGILDGKAHGVFNGKIFVRQDAQQTDAKQTNKTLLLSKDATINTKPQLEIYADDVKCTHGATVGQLDAESIFYLRTRGISLEEARSLLTFAFANDVVSRIKIEPLRAQLEEFLLETQHLSEGPAATEAI